MITQSPNLSCDQAARIALDWYGLMVTAEVLPGERDQNFRLCVEDGRVFVLKIANGEEDRSFLEAQNQVMARLQERCVTYCPKLIQTRSGADFSEVDADGSTYAGRLITWLPGEVLARCKWHGPDLLRHIGACVGEVDCALKGFDRPALHRGDFPWDLRNASAVIDRNLDQVEDSQMRLQIEAVRTNLADCVAPRLPLLGQSVIHNDANDYNVIVQRPSIDHQQVTGLIDFGDMVHSYTVAGLAIAVAYAMLDKTDPLLAATRIVEGYHRVLPLSDDELAVVFPMACGRLAVSACMAAVQQRQRPDDLYLSVSQQPIHRALERLLDVHPRFAETAFRHTCGLTPNPAAVAVGHWLDANRDAIAPILPIDLQAASPPILDLSPYNPALPVGPTDEDARVDLSTDAMAAAGTDVAVGRYDEVRLIYTDAAFAASCPAEERRTVHLGMDLFVASQTPVHAPLDGVVHAVADRTRTQDYGPVIILRHEVDDLVFYTLYGHLSRESLQALELGHSIESGQAFATVGTRKVNGGWPPHLHLQVITDLLDLDDAFPGVCRASQRALWKSFCPDPNLLVGIPAAAFPEPTASKDATLAARRKLVGRNVSIGYDDPLQIVRGNGQYLYDDTGRTYLDAFNNVPHVGHCHPKVVEAAECQMRLLNTNTRYLHGNLTEYAERLTSTLPDPLSVCYFVNSASEANELALRLVRAHTGRRGMIVLEHAYHGNTTSLIDISPYKHDRNGGTGAPDWVHTVPIPDTYRGRYRRDVSDAGPKYAEFVAETIDRADAGIGGFIAESCPSVGGQIILPDGYLAAAYAHVRNAGGLCIADEVQTGYGRIGSHFYAFEAQSVVPDIVVLGKPIGNGHPIAAVITTPAIAGSFDNGMEFFSTFGGNTVSCAVGLAVLKIVQDEGLQAHALEVGHHLLDGLHALRDRYHVAGDVRGAGLFLGVELVRNRDTLGPASAEADFVINRMAERGILMGTDGPMHNVLKIRPPMPFSIADADHLLAALDTVFATLPDY
ncbi:MAG: aminotransferase class III-fold pyridoxal phosphate-dependent enzyme [Planctomycetota bacterium]|jgi:4-aminobutyrate aminotransferase-like enzyme/Ser/Thr protein kinase RdoA (MazF antagonist)|nr:aminotransferase class III-fold pyridoxal phosphate-dependent enzyme [Planctomycetota bacterium]